jgi:histidinol dehydrogenase
VAERRDTPEEVDAVVRDVLAAVRDEGVAALLRFARDFDKVELTEATIRVSAERSRRARRPCVPMSVRPSPSLRNASATYHERQRPADQRFTDEGRRRTRLALTPLESRGDLRHWRPRPPYPSTVR